MVTHVSLDLETWGTDPGCDIRSIGACVFDPVAGTVANGVEYNRDDAPCYMDDNLWTEMREGRNAYGFYIACKNENDIKTWKHQIKPRVIPGPKYPLHRDPTTDQWWSEQSDAAQAAFADPVDLRVALDRFGAWLDGVLPNVSDDPGRGLRLWSHGPAFDPPILAAAYAAVGLPVPWHYRAPRDTRTAFDMAGIDDHSAWLKQHPGPLGIAHHSLDDAICQARAVCGAYERVNEWSVGAARYADARLTNAL